MMLFSFSFLIIYFLSLKIKNVTVQHETLFKQSILLLIHQSSYIIYYFSCVTPFSCISLSSYVIYYIIITPHTSLLLRHISHHIPLIIRHILHHYHSYIHHFSYVIYLIIYNSSYVIYYIIILHTSLFLRHIPLFIHHMSAHHMSLITHHISLIYHTCQTQDANRTSSHNRSKLPLF